MDQIKKVIRRPIDYRNFFGRATPLVEEPVKVEDINCRICGKLVYDAK